MTDDQPSYRALWWLHPAYLEGAPGPWIPPSRFTDDPIPTWKLAVDWMADNGINMVIADIPPFWKDRTYMGWGYHYCIDFDKFPEARVFSTRFTRKNRAILDEIFNYAADKGVQPFTHHYNFCAPVNFVRAHPELHAKLDRHEDGRNNIQDRLGFINGNVCWSEPVYQEFMIECWKEYFRRLPAAAGIMVTPGECHHCSCDQCSGLGSGAERDPTAETITSFIDAFTATLGSVGKFPIVRAWSTGHGPEWQQKLPKGVPYVFKYSVADCVDAGPDPIVSEWIDSGHEVWISKEISGGANGGPTVWTSPRYFHDVHRNCRALGVPGVIGWDISIWGCISNKYPIQWANIEAFTRYASDTGEYDRAPWVEKFTERFGPLGEKFLDALEFLGKVVLGIDKVLFRPGEGYMWMFGYHFAEEQGWPGTLGQSGPAGTEPPEWARGNMSTLAEMVEYLHDNPWDDEVVQKVSAGRKDPFEFLGELHDAADEARRILEEIADSVPDEHRMDFKILRASTQLVAGIVGQCFIIFKARLYYAGATGVSPHSIRRQLARRCIDNMEQAIKVVEMQLEAIFDYPPDILDFDRHLGSEKPWERGLPNRIRHLQSQLQDIRTALTPLLT